MTASATANRSASNAVKHGLTSRTFVPDHARELVDEIRRDLITVYEPKNADETRLVGELSVALWQNYEHDRRFYELQAYELSVAESVFDDQAQARFQEQIAGLKTSPMIYQWRLSESYHGSLYLQNLLQSAIDRLNQNQPLSFQQITDCINATGNDWRLETITGQGGRLMSLHLALVESPETEIRLWVEKSEPLSPERAQTLAEQYHAQAPTPEAARRDLLARLTKELEQVSARIGTLQTEYEERRRLFRSARAGYGLGDPRAIREAMLALRYRTAAFNRSDRIEKELLKLKNERAKTTSSSVHTFRMPAAPAPSRPMGHDMHADIRKELMTIQAAQVKATTPAPAAPLRNEPAAAPARTLKPAFRALKPTSDRKARLARLEKQSK